MNLSVRTRLARRTFAVALFGAVALLTVGARDQDLQRLNKSFLNNLMSNSSSSRCFCILMSLSLSLYIYILSLSYEVKVQQRPSNLLQELEPVHHTKLHHALEEKS